MSIKRIVVIGPESTGKSTLSEGLAKALHTSWVPEYAREYLSSLPLHYTAPDLLKIAQGQIALEESKLKDANNLLICDTDLYVIKVWSEHSHHACPRWVLEQIASRPYDLYLLTDIDFDWQDDPLREHGSPEMRNYFYQQYKDIVQNSGVPWAAISGGEEQRLHTSLARISQLW